MIRNLEPSDSPQPAAKRIARLVAMKIHHARRDREKDVLQYIRGVFARQPGAPTPAKHLRTVQVNKPTPRGRVLCAYLFKQAQGGMPGVRDIVGARTRPAHPGSG